MSAYTEFFLKSNRSVAQLELLEISHPLLSQTYRFVRNARAGVTVTHEDASSQDYTYLPIRITSLGTRDDLDMGLNIVLGDVGKVLPKEIDRIDKNDGYDTPPTVKYRTYRSDTLTAPLLGPITLQMQGLSFSKQGASFQAKPPRLNFNKTGELYRLDRFPMLRGFLF